MSEQRLTFRKTCDLLAYQKQLRDRYIKEGCPLNESDLNLKNAIVKKVNRKMAESIILKYEWLGTLPMVTHFYGIFFKNYCAGVCCIGVGTGGANINAYKEFNLNNQFELAYLARGANVHWSPIGANSKLVSLACRLLALETNVKIVIAYSDTDAGEIGTIYQACNWTCIGRGSSTMQWIDPRNGRVYDQKHPSNLKNKHGGTRAYWVKRLRKEGWKEQKSNPKIRYVCVLDKKDQNLNKIVISKKTQYPKRPTAAIPHMGEGQSFQTEGAFDSTVPLNNSVTNP